MSSARRKNDADSKTGTARDYGTPSARAQLLTGPHRTSQDLAAQPTGSQSPMTCITTFSHSASRTKAHPGSPLLVHRVHWTVQESSQRYLSPKAFRPPPLLSLTSLLPSSWRILLARPLRLACTTSTKRAASPPSVSRHTQHRFPLRQPLLSATEDATPPRPACPSPVRPNRPSHTTTSLRTETRAAPLNDVDLCSDVRATRTVDK